MAIARRFINGNKVRFAGIAQVDELPEAVSVDVLDVVGSEVEIYAGPASALTAFLDETRTTVDSVVTLADGTEVSIHLSQARQLAGNSEAEISHS